MAGWDAPASFDEYVRARHRELLRFAYMLVGGDSHLAADLVQDALERVGLHWRRVRNKDDPEGYVRRIIVNSYLNRIRRLRHEHLVADVPEPSVVADPGTRQDAIWALLRQLPRRQRAVLVLQYYEDLPEAAIADLLGCSVGAVKSSRARALARLRTTLDGHAVEGVR
jgi:RNA polymerase sigma-70 factor (sigma-E family)